MRIAVFILLLLTTLSLSAQTFTGKVKGKKGELLVGASVVASTESKSTVAYCLTSDKGEYRLNIPKGKSLQNVIFVAGNEYKTAFHCNVQYKVKYNERNMKLRDKDTKKYLLTVFVATFVAYIIPAVVLYLGHFMGIMLTICISLFNLSMALLAWLWAKSVRKEFF